MRDLSALSIAGLLVGILLGAPLAQKSAAAPPAPAAVPTDPKAIEFFEKRIRPVLTEHCAQCHSAEAAAKKKLKGGLLLDSREGMLSGGDSGPALVPKKPDESLLIQTIRYDGDLQMPPKGKLPASVIADFETWVKMGAPDPRQGPATAKTAGMSIEEGRKFWAYKPVSRPAVLEVTNHKSQITNPIDAFILAKLQEKGLKPAPDADKSVLIRRLYYDLHGLPPTPEEVDAFVNDTDSKAYEKLVDRLLASPRFGERWGRHWLDIARYAESVTLRGLIFKEAWRYRDYVIDSFNQDVPYDRFVKEQLAGDLLPAESMDDRTRQIVATSYLQMGNNNLEEQDKKQLRMDVVDEQLDVISKGLLAQTVTCARCHDHKFDPIPTADYYALAGILRNVKALETANVSRWVEVPLPAAPGIEKQVKEHAAAVAALQAKIKAARAKAPPGSVTKGVLAIKNVPGIVVDDDKAMKVGEWKHSTFNNSYVGTGYSHDINAGKGSKTVTFQPELPATGKYEVWFAYTPGENRDPAVPVTVFSADGEKEFKIDQRKLPGVNGRFISLGQYRFEKDGQSFVLVSNEGTEGHVIADAVAFIPADEVPKLVPPKKAAKGKEAAETIAALESQLKKLQAKAPDRPMAMSVIEEQKIEDCAIHVRGIVQNLGPVVPRGFLQVASYGPQPKMPADESGRVQLADWIASKENPLTARVYANRAWHWLFGSGIVRTVDNFGTTGEMPSHPELLDYLASDFVANGWSVKKLVRSIVLSRAYRQSADADAKTVTADPENRLFSRANRRRLEAEAIRDTILSVSGKLSEFSGGLNFPEKLATDYSYKHTSTARSVYLPAFRNSLPEIFEAFDYADPSMVTGRRSSSTVAPQALFMMNNPLVVEQAKHAAARLVGENLPSDDARITRAYRLALGRLPTGGERQVAAKFLANQSGDPKAAWATLFQVLFASAVFRYVE